MTRATGSAAHTDRVAVDDAPIALPCPACGYDLRALPDGRCPECGRGFTRVELGGRPEITWEQRRQRGRTRTFLQTVWLALRHPRKLATQIGRDVSNRDARRFHLLCCALGWLGLAPLVTAVMYELRDAFASPHPWTNTPAGPRPPAPPLPWTALLLDGLVLAAALAGLFAWLVTATGVACYFFHPRDVDRVQQDRAVALSYYAAAPLSLLPVVAVTLGVCALIDLAFDETSLVRIASDATGGILLLALPAIAGGWFVVIAWMMLRAGLRRSLGRAAAMTATLLVATPALCVVWIALPALLVLWVEAVILMLAR